MKRNPPARAAPWRPSSPTLCTRWVHACWVNSSVCWMSMHVHEQWGQGGPLFTRVVGCLGCLSPLAPWRLNCLGVRSSPHGSVVTLQTGGWICRAVAPLHPQVGLDGLSKYLFLARVPNCVFFFYMTPDNHSLF